MNAYRAQKEKEEEIKIKMQTYDSVKARSTKFSIQFDPTNNTVATEWRTKADVRKMKLKDHLLNFTVQHYEIDETEKPLTCFTECLVQCDDGTYATVRSHPNYQNKGPWNDWGMVRHGNKIVPAKFHVLVDNPSGGVEAIVELGEKNDKKKGSVITSSWSFPLLNNDFEGCRYHQIDMSDYVRPCLVFEKKTTQQILVVLPYGQWFTKF